MCGCMMKHGVRRHGALDYRCAKCGEDVTFVFMELMSADEGMADYLIEIGEGETDEK